MSDDPDRSGYAVSSLDEIGEGYGFRKLRSALGVTAFGINAVVLIAGGKDGYVGRDGIPVGRDPHDGPPGAP
jgi:hypothetical protein